MNTIRFNIKRTFFKWLGSLILLFSISTAQTQNILNNRKGIVYDREVNVDLRLHTFGWLIGMQFGKIKTYYKTNYYEWSIGELCHSKEASKTSEFSGLASSNFNTYTYGKQNSVFALRGGIGSKRYYSEKAAHKGVAVGISYSAGVSLALLKPYYLELQGIDRATSNIVKYSPAIEKDFLDIYKIKDNASFQYGLNEVSVIPGGYARAGVHLDWGAFDEFLKALEVGIQLDIYPKKIPILVTAENYPYFMNFYLSLQLGKRK